MRLVHEYNREKVERYLHKKRLEKIAALEELDRRGEFVSTEELLRSDVPSINGIKL